MKALRTSLIALALFAIAVPAMAGTTYNFTKGGEDINPVDGTIDNTDYNFNDAANWDNGVPVDGVVGDLNVLRFTRKYWNRPLGLDVNGANINLPNTRIQGEYNGDVMTWYDSAQMTPNYKTDPVPNTLLNGKTDFTPVSEANLVDAANASPTLTLNRIFYNKEHQVVFMLPVVVDSIEQQGTPFDFYGDVTVSTETKFTGRGDTDSPIEINAAFSSPTISVGDRTSVNANSASMSFTTLNIDKATGTWTANADGAAGGAAATINVNSGTLNMAVAQTNMPTVTVAAYAALRGDLTGATYGAGANQVNLAEDAILALTANEPVDTTPAVADAQYWLAATDPNGTYEAGNIVDSVYKGVAFSGAIVTSNANCTFQTPAGSTVDLDVLVFGSGRKKTDNMSWLSDTGVANIYAVVSMTGDGGAINNNYAGGRTKVTTFNFLNPNDNIDNNNSTKYDDNLYNHGGSSTITSDQTFNINEGTFDVNRDGGIAGTLNIDDHATLVVNRNGANALGTSATAQININDGGALTVRNDGLAVLEGLLPAQVVGSGDYTVSFRDQSNSGGTYFVTMDNTNNVNLATLIAGAQQIGLQYHDDRKWMFDGDGLTLKQGQFISTDGYQNKRTEIMPGSFIQADAAATSVGLSAGNGQRFRLSEVIIGLAGKELLLNDSTRQVVTDRGHRDDATGIIELNVAVSPQTLNLDGGEVEDLIGQSLTNLVLNGLWDTQGSDTSINGTLSGTGNITGSGNLIVSGAINAGNSVGQLGNGQGNLDINTNATIQMEVLDPTAGAGTGYDTISVGTADFYGGWNLELVADANIGVTDVSDQYIVMTAGGYTGDPHLGGTVSGLGWDVTNAALSMDGNNLVLTGVFYSGAVQAGDFNGDGAVEAADLALLLGNWGQTAQPGTWTTNWDGFVDANELADLLGNWGAGLGTVTLNAAALNGVPEPATMTLLALGAMAASRRRRK